MPKSELFSNIDRRTFIATAGVATAGAAFSGDAAGQITGDIGDLSRIMSAEERSATSRFRHLMEQAGIIEGVRLNLEQMAFASKFSHHVFATPAAGLEQIDPLELRHGITQGMMYVDSSTSDRLRGFYVVRAIAPLGVRLGEQPVRVEMLRGGVVQAWLRGMAHVWSLTVPPNARAVQAQIGLEMDAVVDGRLARADCWVCPNGVTICVETSLCGPDGLLPTGCG